MERLQEIAARREEILTMLEDDSVDVDLEALKAELEALKAEEEKIKAEMEDVEEMPSEEAEAPVEEEESDVEELEEKRSLAEAINNKEIKAKEMEIKEEIRKMEKFTVASPEYRDVWAKKLMNIPLSAEERAVGDAVATTATTFVAADATHQGINNGGLFIPESVRADILAQVEIMSPFYRDIKKLNVAGNVNLPFLIDADDAAWYAELTNTANEGQEYGQLQLTGHELAKNVAVTWKLESMAVADFINFITNEIALKMGAALATAVLYGDGSGQPTGALDSLTANDFADPIGAILAAYGALSEAAKVGAKAYISPEVNMAIVGYKDANDNYPYLAGVPATGFLSIEVDPYLQNTDILVGNPANYVINFSEQLSVVRESSAVGRKTVYGAYLVADGKPKTGAFAYGTYTAPGA